MEDHGLSLLPVLDAPGGAVVLVFRVRPGRARQHRVLQTWGHRECGVFVRRVTSILLATFFFFFFQNKQVTELVVYCLHISPGARGW